jgi:hypothetical protein
MCKLRKLPNLVQKSFVNTERLTLSFLIFTASINWTLSPPRDDFLSSTFPVRRISSSLQLSPQSYFIYNKDGLQRFRKGGRRYPQGHRQRTREAQWFRSLLQICFGRCCMLFSHSRRSYPRRCVSCLHSRQDRNLRILCIRIQCPPSLGAR